MDWKKRKYCGEITADDAGKDVLLMGWVDAIRDHGHVIFIHLRDIRGIVQVVFDEEKQPDCYERAVALHDEYVIQIKGVVTPRAEGTTNPNLNTGEVEVVASTLDILAKSKSLPFHISEKAMVFGEELHANPENVDEDLRLHYRYLDLRRPSVQSHFLKRHQVIKVIREFLDSMNFVEVETPVLTKSTPEGARDYLVPSRVHPGTFYALPQSPQLFKQLLMMSGMDRYYQVVRCFRDEDLRPNRQPEFTQIDLEASFIDEEFIYETLEELTVRMFRIGDVELPRPFPRMLYDEAMNRYGSDRPDLRFEMAFEDVTDVLENTGYGIFNRIIHSGGHVKGFCIKGHAETLSKNVMQNEYAMKVAPSFGAKGMTWMKVVNGSLEANIVQFFSQEEQNGILQRFQADDGDVIVMIADASLQLVNSVLGKLRLHFAERLNMLSPEKFCPIWITDFPMFEMDGDRLSSVHHPFTMPSDPEFDPTDQEAMLKLKSRGYDLVVNGEELGGGSIRIHRMDIQQRVFQALGMDETEIEAKFGYFLKALDYGAPPHGGLALGMDRVVAMILGLHSIRDVIAFPKNRSAVCPLTQAPSPVDQAQLEELSLSSQAAVEKYKEEQRKLSYKEKKAAQQGEKISKGQVKHVARLARLKLDETQVAGFQKDLNSILEYVEMLQELDTSDVQPMHHVLKIKNIWRDDQPKRDIEPEAVLKNAPEEEKDYFKVPRILEG